MNAVPHRSQGRSRGLLAIAVLVIAYAFVVQGLGWAQTSYYALLRALGDGTAVIDAHHWQTRDKAWVDGHFYSVKAPGLAFATLPVDLALRAVGAPDLAGDAAARARADLGPRFAHRGLNLGNYGFDLRRAVQVRVATYDEAPMVWALGLVGCGLAAGLLLLLVRERAERLEPGLGAATAVTLGLGTLVLPFATLFFGHVLAALLAFVAFALLWREREGSPRHAVVALAGLAAGLAVTTEYPLAIAAAIVGVYALSRGPVVRRGLAYAAGVAAGIAPLLAYNALAFGSVTHFSYADAVAHQGRTGHALLGLNSGGFFGIGVPRLKAALDLLLSARGLVTLTPVVIAGAAGAVLLYRRGRRAEALTIGAVALAYLVYNAGYYLPFGGGSPGPRFLIATLPFLAVPLALAYRRWPATTLALAVPSVLTMVAATATFPLIGNEDTGRWARQGLRGAFQDTPLSWLGAGHGWAALAPFLVAAAAAVVLAARATPPLNLESDLRRGVVAAFAWAGLALLAPRLLGTTAHAAWGEGRLGLILACLVGGLAAPTLLAARERHRRAGATGRAGADLSVP